MSTESGSHTGDTTPPAQREAHPGESYEHLGERVAAILQAAQQAADDIRRAGQEEAERTRREAQETASAHTENVARQLDGDRRALDELRAELEGRAKQLDEEAEAYRQQKRQEAEKDAAQIRADAEEAAKKAHADALLLQQWLEGTLPRLHEVTDWLERALADAPPTSERGEQSLEDALTPQEFAKLR
jgi:hypothetical protein